MAQAKNPTIENKILTINKQLFDDFAKRVNVELQFPELILQPDIDTIRIIEDLPKDQIKTLQQALNNRPDIYRLVVASSTKAQCLDILEHNITITELILEKNVFKGISFDEFNRVISHSSVVLVDISSTDNNKELMGRWFENVFLNAEKTKISAIKNKIISEYNDNNSCGYDYTNLALWKDSLSNLFIVPQAHHDSLQQFKWKLLTKKYPFLSCVQCTDVAEVAVVLSLIRELEDAGVAIESINTAFRLVRNIKGSKKHDLVAKSVQAIMHSLDHNCTNDNILRLFKDYIKYQPKFSEDMLDNWDKLFGLGLFEFVNEVILSLPKFSIDFHKLWHVFRFHTPQSIHTATLDKDGTIKVELVHCTREATTAEMIKYIEACKSNDFSTVENFIFTKDSLSVKVEPTPEQVDLILEYQRVARTILENLDLPNHPELLSCKGAGVNQHYPQINTELALAIAQLLEGKILTADFIESLKQISFHETFHKNINIENIVKSILVTQPFPILLNQDPELALQLITFSLGTAKVKKIIESIEPKYAEDASCNAPAAAAADIHGNNANDNDSHSVEFMGDTGTEG